MKTSQIDMCSGPLLKNIIIYTIPIILTNILQLLFNAVDLIVVGRFCGSVSVAAVGATGSLIHLITFLFVELSDYNLDYIVYIVSFIISSCKPGKLTY